MILCRRNIFSGIALIISSSLRFVFGGFPRYPCWGTTTLRLPYAPAVTQKNQTPLFCDHVSCGTITPLTSAQEVKSKCLSQHHLPGSQHAAPATVRGQSGARQGRELLPVGEPHSGPEILAERLHVPHDEVLIRGLTAGFCWAVFI